MLHKFPRSCCVALATLSLQMQSGSAAQAIPASGAGASRVDVQYREVQSKLAQGWNTWDVNSMTTYVLLPEGLGIHVGFLNNGNDFGHEFLGATGVGQGAVFPGAHSWDGSYTELKVTWKGHEWRVQTAHEDKDLVLLVTPLDRPETFFVPAAVTFQVDFLWDRPGTALKRADSIETNGSGGKVIVYCASDKGTRCSAGEVSDAHPGHGQLPVSGAYRAAAFKSFTLFSKEWIEKGHVHENYNAITGNGDDATNSDKFYHRGALLGYMEYLEQSRAQK